MTPQSILLKSLLLAPLLLACVATDVRAAEVPDALRSELKNLATDIAKIVDKNGGGSVAVGEFTGSADLKGHAGPAVQLILVDELAKAGLTVVAKNHKFEVAGRYQAFHDTPENRIKSGVDPREAAQAQGLHAVKLVAYLIDQGTGDFLAERPTGRLIFGSETVPAMLGLNTSNPPLRDPKDLSDSFDRARHEPQADVLGSKITGRTGLFAIELIVKQGSRYVARAVTPQDGLPFVGLRQSDIYGVRLINNSPHEVAVDLRIDGVNCFAFSNSKSQYWIVDPRSSTDVLGWHRNEGVTTEFKVVANFPDTAAGKLNLKPSPSIGLITASFSVCWEKDSQRPGDEQLLAGRGTGFGDDIKFKTKQLPRIIGQIRDNLAVRYEK